MFREGAIGEDTQGFEGSTPSWPTFWRLVAER